MNYRGVQGIYQLKLDFDNLLKNTVPLAKQTQAVAVCSACDTTRDINDEAWYDTTLDFYLGRDLAEDAYATLQQAGSEGHVYRGDIPHSQWVDAQYLKTGYRLLNPVRIITPIS